MCHFCAMLAWLIVQKTNACGENQCEEALFNLIVAFIYIFTFFNVRDEPTRYKYLTFYMICFIENTLLLFTWFFSFNLSTPDILWFRVSGVIGDYALFFLGILCMVLYYVYFHPTVGSQAQKNTVKAQSSTSISFPSDVTTVKNKSLARKSSIDTTHLVLGNSSQSASSSRRKVSLPADANVSSHSANSRKSSNSLLKPSAEQQTSTTTSTTISSTPTPSPTTLLKESNEGMPSDETRL